MFESYYINPEKGIYFTRSAYGDEVEYIYIVDFDSPNVRDQFKSFLRHVEKDGADKKMNQLKSEFRALRELF